MSVRKNNEKIDIQSQEDMALKFIKLKRLFNQKNKELEHYKEENKSWRNTKTI